MPACGQAQTAPRCGAISFAAPISNGSAGRAIKAYLRPEDIVARPIAEGDPNVIDSRIDKIEFLGSYCLVRVTSPALGGQPVTVYLSLNYLAEQRLEIGSRLPLRLLPERMRVF